MKKISDNIPDISVIISCFNQAKWLERCVRSIKNQINIPEKEIEIILINDGSTDFTKSIIKNLKVLKYLKIINNVKNLGLPNSINKGIKKAKGRYIVRVDSDDYASRHMLYLMKLFLDMNREYQAVACDYLKVDNNEKTLAKFNCFKKEIACGVMFRKECLYDIGLYNTKFKMREGHDLRKRFDKKFKIGRLEFPLYKYRQHETNRTKKRDRVKHFDNLLKK